MNIDSKQRAINLFNECLKLYGIIKYSYAKIDYISVGHSNFDSATLHKKEDDTFFIKAWDESYHNGSSYNEQTFEITYDEAISKLSYIKERDTRQALEQIRKDIKSQREKKELWEPAEKVLFEVLHENADIEKAVLNQVNLGILAD